jgi:hypothetical protein
MQSHYHSPWKFWSHWLFGLGVVVLTPACLLAADSVWKVGLAQVKITPEKPVFQAGYASRDHPFEKVETDLYAKALVLEDQAGQRAVLVTSDLIGFTAAVAEPICERIRAKTGLSRDRILLSAAHVHTGPVLSLKAEPHGKIGSADAERTAEYTRQLVDKIAALVIDATAHLQPARLSWGSGVVDFVMNRREFTPNGVILGVNPRGLADRTVPVLRIDTPDGKPLAVLFGAAVHNTTLGQNNYEICGDYAGFAQTFVQERLPDVQAMFILGCAGDANPYPRGNMQLAREHGATLGREVCRVLGTKLRPIHGSLKVAFDQVELPLQKLSRGELEKLAQTKRDTVPEMAKQILAKLDRGEQLSDHYRCPFTVWQLGRDLTLVGLSGEVVVDYVPLLEKALGPNRLWLAAYSNDVYGYLPSARVLQEGGYETRGLYAGGLGFFSPKAQDVVVETVRALAQKAGRELPTESGRLELKK